MKASSSSSVMVPCTPSRATDSLGANFYKSYANSAYEIPIPQASGQSAAGDLNSTYFALYYSITNLDAWVASHGNNAIELVIVGTFPKARYFSITGNDMHYTVAQHLADADLDPVGGSGNSYINPFVVTGNGTSYSVGPAYLLPVSMGSVPSTTLSGCAIDPFEEDNLLDGTQRHLSMDWNANVHPPSVSQNLQPHMVEVPGHSTPPPGCTGTQCDGSNTAGSVVIRSYLEPPYVCSNGQPTCTASLLEPPPCPVSGGCTCPFTNGCATPPAPIPNQYVIVRDVTSGCAYEAQYVLNNMMYAPNENGGVAPPKTQAFLSKTDLAQQGYSNWMDAAQQTQHTDDAGITAQACYANGDPAVTSLFPNKVAWARSPEWRGTPGPDDSYIGSAISTTGLAGMISGSACTHDGTGETAADGCVMRFRFWLPSHPTTPCNSPYSACDLTNTSDLRYTSLTFWQQENPPASANQYYTADTDGVAASTGSCGNCPFSLVSLADSAFAAITDGSGNQYVTLIVTTGAKLPSYLQETASGSLGQPAGVQPVTAGAANYSVWTAGKNNTYTVLDLSQFPAFSTADPLLLTIRNTLPKATFACSAIPFSTAEYTNADGNGAGLMGPYAPRVDYVDPLSLKQTQQNPPFTVPSAQYCGVLPSGTPYVNQPSLSSPQNDCTSSGQNCVNFPEQFWSSSQGPPPNLYCPTSSLTGEPPTPEIYFVATQFPTPAITWAMDQGNENCATPTTQTYNNPAGIQV
jgi:hypothetical protein